MRVIGVTLITNSPVFRQWPAHVTATAIGVLGPADFWAFDSMRRGPMPQTLPHKTQQTHATQSKN